MLEDRLSKLIDQSFRRSRSDANPIAWIVIGAVAYLLRRSLRDVEQPQRVVLREGDEVTLALREQDG